MLGQYLYYLRLLTTNGIELVTYDINGLKEVNRDKHPNDFEVS